MSSCRLLKVIDDDNCVDSQMETISQNGVYDV